MKKESIIVPALLCLCAVLPFHAFSQNDARSAGSDRFSGSISGRLTDSLSGEPLEYANVALFQSGSVQPTSGRVTDKAGRFSFPDLAPGKYDIAVSFIGYENKIVPGISITAENSKAELGNLALAPVTTQLQEVTVQTLRPSIVRKADRLVVNIEGSALAAGNSAYDVLGKAPGVYIDPEGNIQLSGRSGVTVMLNEKLTYLSARDLRTLLEGMPAENIKNIEIITNPSAKYDAEGSSGILNINLIKNVQQGINGSLYTGYSYNGKQHGYSVGGNINYKTEKWNSFLNLDMNRRVGGREATFTRVFYGERDTYFDQVATGNYVAQGPPEIRLGTDYSLSKQQIIGVRANFTMNDLQADFLTDTYIGYAPDQPEMYIDANNYMTNRFSHYSANVHYSNQFDTLGTSLSADLDFIKIFNTGESYFYNYYKTLASDQPAEQDFLYTRTPNGFDIYAAKVDYAKTLKNEMKFEAGAKVSSVISDNDSRFYFNNTEVPVPDLSRTNHFIYDENIYAAYINLSAKLGERITLQAGLRAEGTQSRGASVTTGEVTDRNYLNFFPSLFVQQKINDAYGINYSYSRRIQRPNYGSLNPFISYRDPYTYIQGNPGLRPQFTHSFDITQTYKESYSLVLNYQIIKDVISELPILVEETATTIYTTGNVDDSQNLSLTANAPAKILKNWDTNNSLVLAYNEYRMVVDDMQLVNDQVFYMLQSNHTILLPFNLRMEVNAAYRGPAASGLYHIAPMWWVHAGLKRTFMKEKLEISLNINDIFKSYRLKFTTDIGDNINDFDQYFRNRSIGLTLRYNFSKGKKFDTKQRDNTLEELNRT